MRNLNVKNRLRTLGVGGLVFASLVAFSFSGCSSDSKLKEIASAECKKKYEEGNFEILRTIGGDTFTKEFERYELFDAEKINDNKILYKCVIYYDLVYNKDNTKTKKTTDIKVYFEKKDGDWVKKVYSY